MNNSAAIHDTTRTARARLGDVLKFHREQREITPREVSRRARCSIADVESWERGATVPNGEQWKALSQGINRSLHAYNDLRLRALAEQEAEQQTITRSIAVHAPTNGTPQRNNPATKIGTNIGAKLTAIGTGQTGPVLSAPTPAPDVRTVNPGQAVSYVEVRPTPERRTRAQMPGGAMSSAEIERRKSYVRDLLTKRPKMRTSGADSVLEDVRRVFGVGISPDVVEEIREQIKQAHALAVLPQTTIDLMNAEQAQRELDAKFAAMTRAAQTAQPTGAVNHDDLEAAVQLVLGAVPNLRTFSISVDEHGEASIDYTVREVVVRETAGSLKVRRG